ncbi:hypothetical protein BGX20_000520 [Mortierella sp. AD010]|nr:hypothetical protein BGX20_000520 [Mortierella sp. AD010]
MSAMTIGIDDALRIHKNMEGELEFFLSEASLKSWLETHQDNIGVKFTLKREPNSNVKSSVDEERSDYVCQCGCLSFDPSTCTVGGKAGEPRKRASSIFSGCKSSIAVVKRHRVTSPGDVTAVVKVLYQYHHSHAVGMKGETDIKQKYQIIWRRIMALMRHREDIRHALHQLVMDKKRFLRCSDGSAPKLSPGSVITYDDIYYVLYHVIKQETHKDNNPFFSATKWMRQLAQEGFFTFHDPQGKFYGFSSPWQLEQFQKNGDVLCFDGTKVCGSTGTGVPVAFFITCKLDPEDLSQWLYRLRKKIKSLGTDCRPAVIVTDRSNAEIRAISKAFSSTQIFYCAWRVLQTWERIFSNDRLGISHLPKDKREGVRAKLRNDLRTILYDKDKVSALGRIKQFRSHWSAYPFVTDHLDKNYFNEDSRRRWMLCYRQSISYNCIDINNNTESWRNTIETYFFMENRNIRADSVIYGLVRMVLPRYQQKQLHYTLHAEGMIQWQQKVRNARLGALDIQRQAGLPTKPVHKFVMTTNNPSIIAVSSFTNPHQKLKVTFEREKGLFTGCTCLDYSRSRKRCKHISLAMLEIPFTDFEGRVDRDETLDDFTFVEPLQDPETERDKIVTEVPSLSPPTPSVDMLSYYIKRVYELEQARDTDVKLPQHTRERLEDLMKQVYDISRECFAPQHSEATSPL